MSPLFAVPPFSRHQEKGFDWVVPVFQGCHGYLPCSLASGTPLTFLGTSSQAYLLVMSLNVAKYHLGKVKM